MENVHSVWQIGIIALIAGALIGALAYRLFAPAIKQSGKIKTELDEVRNELDSYKASVDQHFDKTSELVNDLTQNYVKVYQHLAEGAQTLGDSKTFTNLLEQHQGRVSIAVDDETNTADRIVDDSIVDAPPATPVAAVDEHAEPFADSSAAKSAEPGAEDEAAAGKASTSSVDAGAEAVEPVLNVDALKDVGENADAEAPAEARRDVPEDELKKTAGTTAH